MKVFVVFDYPEINDPDGDEADFAIDSLLVILKTLLEKVNMSGILMMLLWMENEQSWKLQ